MSRPRHCPRIKSGAGCTVSFATHEYFKATLTEQLLIVMRAALAAAKIGASIGIALYPIDGTTFDELMQRADKSMYQIKRKGKNNYGFACPVLQN